MSSSSSCSSLVSLVACCDPHDSADPHADRHEGAGDPGMQWDALFLLLADAARIM